MRIDNFHFGSVEIDGVVYEHDVVIDHLEISKRKKKASKRYRDQFGHTPVSHKENIPWNCRRLIIGTGKYGSLPVMDEVRQEAKSRNVELILLPTDKAIQFLNQDARKTNAILHLTC